MNTAARTSPSYRETTDFIRNEAFYQAQNSVAHRKLFKIHDNIFTIAPGVPDEFHIGLNADGTLDIHHSTSTLPLYLPPMYRSDIFTRTWFHTNNDIATTLKTLTETTMGVDWETICNGTPVPEGERPLDKVIQRTADGIRSTLGHGYISHPSSLGYGKLRNFIGRDRVNEALGIAGPKATFQDFNTICRHRESFTQAAAANPNAVILWFLNHRHNEHPLPEPTTCQEILDQAKQVFLRTGNSLRHDPESVWATAAGLNTAAIMRHSQSIWSIANIADLAHGAHAQPSYTAVATMARFHAHPAVCHPFIRESHARLTKRNKTQTELATQYAIIVTPHNFKNTVNATGIQDAYQRLVKETPEGNDLSWEHILQRFPKEVCDLKEATPRHQKPRPRTRPPHQTSTPRKPRAQAPDHQQLDEILNGPAHAVLHHLMRNTLSIDTKPGNYVQLKATGRSKPFLTMTRHQDGTISHRSEDYWVKGELPGPAHPFRTNIHWTTRGLQQAIITRKLLQHLRQHWDAIAPTPRTLLPSQEKLAVHVHQRLEQASRLDPAVKTDQQLSDELIEAVASLADPQLHQALTATCGTVDTDTYNMAAPAKDIFIHLYETNPGALTWLMNTDPPKTAPQHPGELISRAKQDMLAAGLHPSSWRTAATLDTETMRRITSSGENLLHQVSPQQRTTIINTIAANNIKTSADNIGPAIHMLRRTLTMQNITALAEENSRTAIALALKAQSPTIGEEYQDAADYIRDMTLENAPIRARTWNSLLKAAARWHRDIRNTPTKKRWNSILYHQDSHYRAWPTALDTHQDGDFTITPLTSEYDLYQESLDMEHCVIGYGDDCAIHNSRIFSITRTKDMKKMATAEIKSYANTWTAVQVRAKRNHEPQQEAIAAAQRLAERYQTAEQEAAAPEDSQDAASRFWWVHEPTRATVPEQAGTHATVWDEDELPF